MVAPSIQELGVNAGNHFRISGLPRNFSLDVNAIKNLKECFSPNFHRRCTKLLGSDKERHHRYAVSAMNDRILVNGTVTDLLTANGFNIATKPILSRSHAGKPTLICRGSEFTKAREDGFKSSDLHVSFSHDGDIHVCALGFVEGMAGLGIDVVYLPRLRHHTPEYLYRFARKFMSDTEYASFMESTRFSDFEQLVRRVSGHFSFMESASKALGTGLKIGAGMGGKTSLPKQSMGILDPFKGKDFLIAGPAIERIKQLDATILAGHIAIDDEYLITMTILI